MENGFLIEEILINENKLKGYSFYNSQNQKEEKLENKLKSLSKSNIFIGANNSGKSRFMRELFYDDINVKFLNYDSLFLRLNNEILTYNNNIKNLKEHIDRSEFTNETSSNYNFITIDNIVYYGISQIKTYINNEMNKIYNDFKNMKDLTIRIEILRDIPSLTDPNGKVSGFVRYKKEILKNINNIIEYLKEIKGYLSKIKKIYIPTLRGLRPYFNDEKKDKISDVYAQRTQNDYFPELNNVDNEEDYENHEVFTGLTLYQQVKEHLLGDLNKREIIAEYQRFLSENFFENEEITLIPKINDDVLTIKIGNEDERPVYELGDGIQSIIILTFPLFVNKGNKALFFIEEPELNLHPYLQRVLIDVFNYDSFKDYQYFFTTHSNHFLDLTLDFENISIYTFKKQIENENTVFNITNVHSGDFKPLELLGVRNSSVFLANCTIWVEGITDRLYLRQFLRVYAEYLGDDDKKFREGLHYAFIEYEGNNITHWSFLDQEDKPMDYKFINQNIFLIADDDGGSKSERHKKLKESLGNNFYKLPVREIENILSWNIIKNVIAEYEGKDSEELNFKVKITEKTYKNKKIDKFIDGNLLGKHRKYGSESGTIKDKINFCRKAVNNIKNYCDLSSDAKKLVEALYHFIEIHNSQKETDA